MQEVVLGAGHAPLLRSGRSQALAAYVKAIQLNPRNAGYWNSKGNALAELRRYRQALVAYEQALNLHPDNAIYQSNKTRVLNALNGANSRKRLNALFERIFGPSFSLTVTRPIAATKQSLAKWNPVAWVAVGSTAMLVLCVCLVLALAWYGNQLANVPDPTVTTSQNQFDISQPTYQASLSSPVAGWAMDDQCFFWSDGYHVKDVGGDPTKGARECNSPLDNVGDGNVSIQVKQVTGPKDYFYGLQFRAADNENYYVFGIKSSGSWIAGKLVRAHSENLVDETATSLIHQDLSAVNTIAVSMKGTHLEFYINGVDVGGVYDTAFSKGTIGVWATKGQDVVFTDFKFATL